MKKHILFVDDQKNVLQGLRRLLHHKRNEWQMSFAISGAEALTMLDQQKIDVVVSDMHMPGMDGAELLTTIKKRFPDVVRIVLSGHADQRLIYSAVLSTHQYLSKPCDPEKLKNAIDRSCRLREIMNKKGLKRAVAQIGSLPSLPAAYTEIMREIQSPTGSLAKVGSIISKDLAMAAKVLQLVNSAFFGLPRKISDPAQAVNLLGMDTVKALVLTIEVFSSFKNRIMSAADLQQLWDHSFWLGKLAQQVARSEGQSKALVDDAYMAGLLHDIGKLVLAANLPEGYRAITQTVKAQAIPAIEAEKKLLDATHAEIGAYLLELWGLPESIIEAVAYHHQPEMFLATEFGPTASVYAAHLITRQQDLEQFQTEIGCFTDPFLERLNKTDRLSAWVGLYQNLVTKETPHE